MRIARGGPEVIEPGLGAPVELPSDPVERARKRAELQADVDMQNSIALTQMDPETLQVLAAGSRIIADLTHRRLSIVGLRAGEAIMPETDHKLAEVLERWNAWKPDSPRVIEAEGGQAEEAAE